MIGIFIIQTNTNVINNVTKTKQKIVELIGDSVPKSVWQK